MLEQAGLPVTRVSEHTGAPEILGGRVKTLHPRVHGGILAKRGDASHQADLEQQNIAPIDVVVVNLYPCLLYTSPSPRDRTRSRMPSSA